MTPEEIAKQAREELNKAFDEFKKANDERLRLIETKGHAPADFETKLAKINDALDAAEKKQKGALDEIEKKLNRLELGGAGLEPEKKAAQERKAAFIGALRRGVQGLTEAEVKVLVVSNDTTGGVFAPPELVQEVIKAEVLYSPMRSLVRVRQTGSPSVMIPKRTGTAAATWVGETQTRNESQNPSWGNVAIPMGEMYAETRVTFADLEDSQFPIEQFITDEFAEQFGVAEGAAIVSGNGVNKPLGFLDANAAGPGSPIAYTPSGQAATIAGAAAGAAGQADPLISLFHDVKTAYAGRGSWVLNRKSLGVVRKFKDTTGQYLWQPGVGQSGTLNGGLAPTILGAPYTEVPDMPDEGANAFPIGFGDWQRAITLVDRIAMSVTRDALTVANAGQVKFFARRRLGAQVVLGEAIRLLKCATS